MGAPGLGHESLSILFLLRQAPDHKILSVLDPDSEKLHRSFSSVFRVLSTTKIKKTQQKLYLFNYVGAPGLEPGTTEV